MENVWTMSESKVLPPPGEILKESVTVVVEGGPDPQQLPAEFTLRVNLPADVVCDGQGIPDIRIAGERGE